MLFAKFTLLSKCYILEGTNNDEDGNESTPNINHEIDIEMYGTNNVIYSSYLKDTTEQTHVNTKLGFNITDNLYHTYRFDWYNGEKVEFYIDDVLVCTINENIPTQDHHDQRKNPDERSRSDRNRRRSS